MHFDLYLSEMSISNLHGGGLTIQRILGNDVLQIKHLAYLNRFATDYPSIASLKDRELNFASSWDSNRARSVIGSTRANAISNNPLIMKLTARKAAGAIHKKLKGVELANILVCPQGAASVYTIEALKRYGKVNYVSWVMDDHLIKYDHGSWYYPAGLEPLFKKHLKEAAHVFVISTAMQEFYRNRFGIESSVLFGPADFNGSKPAGILSEPTYLKIGYFGAVTEWQLDALEIVAKALKDSGTQLHIYSGIEKLPAGLSLANVQLKDKLDPGDVLPVMRNYDAVVLPISFRNEMRSMSQFNIATKMSEYLASGVPILAVGPAYAAMTRYLKEKKAAVIADDFDVGAIKIAFNLLNDATTIAGILVNAKKLAIAETGTLAMRGKWLEGTNKTEI